MEGEVDFLATDRRQMFPEIDIIILGVRDITILYNVLTISQKIN